jgi:5-methylcytosine-specific restriction endonuclease McrA
MPSMFCLTCGQLTKGSRCPTCERLRLNNYGLAHRRQRRAAITDNPRARCAQCGSTRDLQLDHVDPIRGGRHQDTGRRQVLCRTCNRDKG